jgi:hypothetical protein
MLYKFKSKAAGDVIMLEAHGRRLLGLIGKDPGPTGIILPGEMPGALQALEHAIAEDEAHQRAQAQEARSRGLELPQAEAVTLRQRAVPLMDMMRRCASADHEITWGV